MSYDELVKRLREPDKKCDDCSEKDNYDACLLCIDSLFKETADAIEELLKAAKKMHTWIFLNSGDEQVAYDECGLSDEMNAALGYCGQFELRPEPPKEEQADPCSDCRHYPPSSTDGKPCCACDPSNPLTNCHDAKEET